MPKIILRSATVVRFVDNSGQFSDEAEGLDYLFGVNFGFQENERIVAVRVSIHAIPAPKAANEPHSEPGTPGDSASEVEVECVFQLDSLEEFRAQTGDVKLPRPFLAHLLGITASTARGVFIGAGHSPLLQKAPLPIGAPILMIDEVVDDGEYPWAAEARAIERGTEDA